MSNEIKKVCKCESCGNEAEMVITCSLPEDSQPKDTEHEKKVKGTGTCSHCGNEAEMWIDM